ncbi:holo-ACP synthase [Brevibacillus sp. SYSU BS000544]|uniref:holo-ACP synthase n=1 Tax=Brevibacillus sp. SYSU BS000544 TaxID=3416443 RepID=UPI003CE570AF
MITGIGIDIVELKRIDNILHRKQGFIDRVLAPNEKILIENKSPHRITEIVAGRFAAKEAVAKALGTGIGAELCFHDIVILPDEKGKPQVTLRNHLHTNIHVSISHSREYAVAQVIIEQV